MSERFSGPSTGRRISEPAPDLRLASQLASLLPQRPRLLDLAPAAGALFQFLAPLIARAQVWAFADSEDALLGTAFNAVADWAEDEGYAVTWPSRAMIVHTRTGAWRVEGLVRDLTKEGLGGLPFARVDAVVCTGLLDRVSTSWLQELAKILRVPFYACLIADGHDRFAPRHPLDRLLTASLRGRREPDVGSGPALGDAAPETASRVLASHSFALRSSAAEWRAPGLLLPALIRERALAGRRAFPLRRSQIDSWEAARTRQAAVGRLAIWIGLRDILAIPARR